MYKSTFRQKMEWKYLLIEVLLIVLGVVLALGLNQWREERSQAGRARIALEHVKTEVRVNRRLLKHIHTNNRETLANMDSSGEGERQLIPGLQIQHAAWDALLYANVMSSLEYEQVLKFSEIYAYQDIYRKIGEQLVQTLMNATASSGTDEQRLDEDKILRRLKPYLSLMVEIETQLLKLYDNTVGPNQDPAE